MQLCLDARVKVKKVRDGEAEKRERDRAVNRCLSHNGLGPALDYPSFTHSRCLGT